MIRLENIDKYFNYFHKNRIHVINHTSLEFPSNGLVALLGPSGSGKTTLLNVIGGLDSVSKGKIYVNGRKITKRTQGYVDKVRNLNIGYIFQDYKLIEDKSVYENVAISLKLIGIKDKKEIDKRVCYVLDKVGMLRFKKRPCNMLSGGERQRVGIARAIVKNPNIIIADEPTGNLDSKNSIEIMNIVKAISKDKLVILVTHERSLAQFYASRIIELEDGKIVSDQENTNSEELNYGIVNNLYLKDFSIKKDYDDIHVYSNQKKDISLDIVVLNNNIYIRTKGNQKIEVLDEDSTIAMIDDHYKNISKNDILKYQFDFQSIINEPKKIKYSSIFNPITFITNGFKKVLDYSILKKILLVGFFLSGIFIVYALSTMKAAITLRDESFVSINKNYLIVDSKKININEYLALEQDPDISYVLPKDSSVTLPLKVDDFYQLSPYNFSIDGSLTSIEAIQDNNIIQGRMPTNSTEIVVDIMTIQKSLKKDQSKMMGLYRVEDYLERNIEIPAYPMLKIVGIVDLKSPSIYVSPEHMLSIMYHTKDNQSGDQIYASTSFYDFDNGLKYDDYHNYLNDIQLKEGSWPENDYETIVEDFKKDTIKLGKEISDKINGRKLTVVGYYTSKKHFETMFVNYNTMKYYYLTKTSNIAVYPKNKELVLDKVKNEYHMNVRDSYLVSREKYINENQERIRSSLITSLIILIISFIEIFLMIRASFLSRVKEVGIYRAIGVKKKDIYIMFSGESIAITTLASLPGILLSSYIIHILAKIDFLKDTLAMSLDIFLFSIVLLYLFNIVIGLIPVFVTMRKRPAQILSRNDI